VRALQAFVASHCHTQPIRHFVVPGTPADDRPIFMDEYRAALSLGRPDDGSLPPVAVPRVPLHRLGHAFGLFATARGNMPRALGAFTDVRTPESTASAARLWWRHFDVVLCKETAPGGAGEMLLHGVSLLPETRTPACHTRVGKQEHGQRAHRTALRPAPQRGSARAGVRKQENAEVKRDAPAQFLAGALPGPAAARLQSRSRSRRFC